MKQHIILIIVITLLLLLSMFLPFLPGEYDGLSVTLSFIVRLFSIAGLLLVPIGIVWLIMQRKEPGSKHIYRLANIALFISFLVVLVSSLGAFATDKRSLIFGMIGIDVYLAVRIYFKLRSVKNILNDKLKAVPFYLICLPLVLFVFRFLLIGKATGYGRSKAVKKSEQLIADIETYNKTNGHYPASVLSVNKDYKTGIIGIKQYHYELQGNAYNVYFEHFSKELSAKEIVMYNKLDEHEMTSHDQDLLLLSPSDLAIQRGYFLKTDLAIPHWKYFLFD